MSCTPVKIQVAHAATSSSRSNNAGESQASVASQPDARDVFEKPSKGAERRRKPTPSCAPPPSNSPQTQHKPSRCIVLVRDKQACLTLGVNGVDPTTLEHFADLIRQSRDRPCLLATMPASQPHLAPHVISIPRVAGSSLANFLPHIERSWLTRAANKTDTVHFYLMPGQPKRIPTSAFFIGTLADAQTAFGSAIDGNREQGHWLRICHEASKGVPEYLLVVAAGLTSKRYRSPRSAQAGCRMAHLAQTTAERDGQPMRDVLQRAFAHAADAHLEHAALDLLSALARRGPLTDEMRAEHMAVSISSCNTSLLNQLLSRPGYDANMTYKGMPLLHHAVAQSTTMTRVLLQHHADPQAKDDNGEQAHRYTNDVERRRMLSRAVINKRQAEMAGA